MRGLLGLTSQTAEIGPQTRSSIESSAVGIDSLIRLSKLQNDTDPRDRAGARFMTNLLIFVVFLLWCGGVVVVGAIRWRRSAVDPKTVKFDERWRTGEFHVNTQPNLRAVVQRALEACGAKSVESSDPSRLVAQFGELLSNVAKFAACQVVVDISPPVSGASDRCLVTVRARVRVSALGNVDKRLNELIAHIGSEIQQRSSASPRAT
jgi:hypothetical protein